MREDTIRVLIVDDSRFIAKKLEQLLGQQDGIKVVGKAFNGKEALEAIARLTPRCITLDVHMPGMNGLTVLKHVMIRCPTPTLMVSSYTAEGSWVTFDALRYGAVDFYKKPSDDSPEALEYEKKILIGKVIRTSRVKVEAARFIRVRPKGANVRVISGQDDAPVVLIGGTGGYASILQIFAFLSKDRIRPCHIFLDAPENCVRGFARYVKTWFGIPTYVMTVDQEEIPDDMVVFFNNEKFTARYERSISTVVLSGERDILKRFETFLAVSEREGFALEPSQCLVPEMSAYFIGNGYGRSTHLDIARLLEG